MTFFFAWVDASDTTFSSAYEREDEEVLSFDISHQEGDFAALTIDVRNPRTGLLSISRHRWAWLSYRDGSTITPLFFGRLIGLPQEMRDDVVTLSLIAKPQNFQAAKSALASSMQETEYFDSLFIDESRITEADTVLEARPMVWAIDRVSLDVSASHIVYGEDGTIDFGGDAFTDSVRCSYMGAPQQKVVIDAEVSWMQYGFGSFPVRFKNVSTYTGDGLLSDWPKKGARIGGGWFVKSSFAKDVYSGTNTVTVTDSNNTTAYRLYRWSVSGYIEAAYEAQRDFTEKATFTMQSSLQEIVTDAGDEEPISIAVSGKADDPVDSGGALPIGDLRRRSYFVTDRGKQSVAYLANLAGARLMASARCVEISFDVPFWYFSELSLRKNATIADPRLPGGEATGKIKAYSISADGDSGQMVCNVTIGCTPGRGDSVSPSSGTPAYADSYSETYQTATGASTAAVFSGDGAPIVVIDAFDETAANDDGIDLFNMTAATCLLNKSVVNDASDQLMYISGNATDTNTGLTEHCTKLTVELRPVVGGPFETDFEITCSDLVLPKLIDLEAA